MQFECALAGRWTANSPISAAPSGAESFVGAGSGGFASLHHRLISTTPPASKVDDTLWSETRFDMQRTL